MPLVYSHVTAITQGGYPVVMSFYPFTFSVAQLVAVRGHDGSIFCAAQNTLKLTNGFQ
jgi:hypothetical protein